MYGVLELGRCAASVREVLNGGGVPRECRRRGIEVWSSGAREARCRRARRGGMEFGSSGGSLCRRGGMEIGSLRGALQACRRGGMEVGSLRFALQACRRADVEVGVWGLW